MEKSIKLDFGFLKHDDVLEARTKNGYYHIFPNKNGNLGVSGSANMRSFMVGTFSTIYEALDAANTHYSTGN